MRNSTHSLERVSEEARRQNNRAVEMRDTWRRRYKVLASMIKEQKAFCKRYPHDGEENIRLHHLQRQAHLMMLERNDLTWLLRDTAYPWA